MVYTPLAPKSCLTCASRKVKCDMTTPSCNRCIKSGRECGGYRQKRGHFIVSTPKTAAAHATRRKKNARSPSAVEKQQPAWKKDAAVVVNSVPVSPPASPVVQSQLLAHFIDIFCPRDVEMSKYERGTIARIPQFWVRVLPTMRNGLPVLDLATTAVSYAYIGAVKGDTQLVRRGLQAYSGALQEMRKAIMNPKMLDEDGLLIAVHCLTVFEAFEVPDYAPTAWSAHVQAGYSLFARRIDKLQDCSEELRVMCSQLRKQHVYTSISNRKASPFCHPKWRRVMATLDQNCYDRITGELLEQGGIFEDLDNVDLAVNRAQKLGLLRRLDGRLRIQARSLRRWLLNFKQEYPSPYFLRPVAEVEWHKELLATAHFDNVFEFESILVAQTLTHYWTALLFLLQCMMRCEWIMREQFSLTTSFNDIYTEDHEVFDTHSHPTIRSGFDMLDLLAASICMSIPYHLKEEMGAAGPNTTISVLWGAMQYYKMRVGSGQDYQKHLGWCVKAFATMRRQRE